MPTIFFAGGTFFAATFLAVAFLAAGLDSTALMAGEAFANAAGLAGPCPCWGIGRSNALFRGAGAGAAMGWPAPSVEALSGVIVVDGDRPSAIDPGRKRISGAKVVGLPRRRSAPACGPAPQEGPAPASASAACKAAGRHAHLPAIKRCKRLDHADPSQFRRPRAQGYRSRCAGMPKAWAAAMAATALRSTITWGGFCGAVVRPRSQRQGRAPK